MCVCVALSFGHMLKHRSHQFRKGRGVHIIVISCGTTMGEMLILGMCGCVDVGDGADYKQHHDDNRKVVTILLVYLYLPLAPSLSLSLFVSLSLSLSPPPLSLPPLQGLWCVTVVSHLCRTDQ